MPQKFQSFYRQYSPQNFLLCREDVSDKHAEDNFPKTKIVRPLTGPQQKSPT
jgi:hypothetical protein